MVYLAEIMDNNSTKWKDFLLKSSLPLEYEVKKLLDEYKCVGSYEYTYLRKDENGLNCEFSYDIDEAYIKGGHFFNLMIECKFRDPSTDWVFIPEEYGGMDEIDSYCFLNPVDHFAKKKFIDLDYEPLAPLCGKGIELTSGGQNPKTITQAVSQLSYAMAEKILDSMENQINRWIPEVIFYNVPIIVTTANLIRLKENTTIDEIKRSKTIEEIGTKEECLVLKNNIGRDLEQYSFDKFLQFIDKYGRAELNKKLNSFNKDIVFVSSVIAKNYCPQAVAIIQFTDTNHGFQKLFNFFNEIAKPTEKTLRRTRERQERRDAVSKKLGEFKAKSKSKKS